MPTFIDESGDTGHTGGSKPYFRLAAVFMPTESDVEGFRNAIRELRKSTGKPDAFEFKFAWTHHWHEGRSRFISTAMVFPFRIVACCIDKKKGYWCSSPTEEQHWACATEIAVALKPTFIEFETPDRPLREPLFIDNNKDWAFLETVCKQFRGLRSERHPNHGFTKRAKFRNSANDDMLQLADMICGSIGARIDGNHEWAKLMDSKCAGITCL